jgi:Fic family protein
MEAILSSDPMSLAMLPFEGSPELPGLLDRSFGLATAAASLGGSLHPLVRRAVGDLVRSVNCHYSNLIEGHDTLPRDIDRALKGDYSADAATRNLQIEARAHIEAQAMVDSGLLDGLGVGEQLVRRLHLEFCSRLPDGLSWAEHPRTGERIPVVPGEWRTMQVQVGRHVPVPPDMIPAFMAHFDRVYTHTRPSVAAIAAASAHHRLLWIHPFLDGNGRTARLHSHAFLRRFNPGSDLWSLSRGLAGTAGRYRATLARADYPPQTATDGRGTLSGRGLADFVGYVIETCAGQVDYMAGLLEPAGFLERVRTFAQAEASRKRLDGKAYDLLARMLAEGQIARSAVPGVLGVSEHHASRVLEPLLARGLLVSESGFSPYRLAFPLAEAALLFPRLLPPAQDVVPGTEAAREQANIPSRGGSR